MLVLTNNIQYFSSDTTRLYIHKNVITGLLVSVSQNHLSGPPVLRTLLVYSCYKIKLLLKYMCIYILCFHACVGSHLQQFLSTLHTMNIDTLKHNTIKPPLRMSYASKGTAFWDTCCNSYDYVILVILVANGYG